MKVGIAYTTYNRVALWRYGFLKLLRTTLQNPKYKDVEFILSVSDDASRPEELDELIQMVREINELAINTKTILATGELANIAKTRNRALAPVADCDYIFSFEDDIFPYNDAWLEGYCECLNEMGHMMYLPACLWPRQVLNSKIGRYNVMKAPQCGGIMLCFTKEVIANIGGFNSAFEIYGFEHAEFTERANIYLNGKNGQRRQLDDYFTIKEAEEEHWFVSADEKNFTKFRWDLDDGQWAQMDRSSIAQRLTDAQKNESIAKNGAIWQKSRYVSLTSTPYRTISW